MSRPRQHVGTILDDPNASVPRQREDVRHPLRESEGVLGNDRFSPFGEGRAQHIDIHSIIRSDIYVYRPRAAVQNGVRNNGAGESGENDFISFTDSRCFQDCPQGVPPTGEGHYMTDAQNGSEGRFQLLYYTAITWPYAQHSAN
jgi:hypothetical protein